MWCKVLLLILMTNLAQNDQPNAFDFLGEAAPRYIQEEQWWFRKSGWKCELCNQEIILKESIEVVLWNGWDIRSRHQPLLRWLSLSSWSSTSFEMIINPFWDDYHCHHDHHGHHGAMSPELTELARFQEWEGNATHSPLHTTPVFNALRTFYSRLVIYWLIDALEKAAMICKACLHCAHLHFTGKIVHDSKS